MNTTTDTRIHNTFVRPTGTGTYVAVCGAGDYTSGEYDRDAAVDLCAAHADNTGGRDDAAARRVLSMTGGRRRYADGTVEA